MLMTSLFEQVHRYIKRPVDRTKENSNFLWGVVISMSPLTIKFDNNMIITSDFLVLSALCKETVIEIPFRYQGQVKHKHQGVHGMTSSELPEIMLWRGLQNGDKVRALKINGGQQYYVLEREDGVV